MQEVIAALETFPEETQAVVLGGEGPVFSAGHDLAEMLDRDLAFYRELFDVCTQMMEIVHEIPQPVIARVHGRRSGRVPARRRLRPRRGRRRGDVRHTGSEDRALLLDADGPGQSGRRAQAGDGDAVDRGADHAADRPRVGPHQPRRPGRQARCGRGRTPRASHELQPERPRRKKAFYEQLERADSRAYEHAKEVMAWNAELDDAQEGIGASSPSAGRPGATGSAMPTAKVSITQLTPLLFLERSAHVFPERVAIVYG